LKITTIFKKREIISYVTDPRNLITKCAKYSFCLFQWFRTIFENIIWEDIPAMNT